MTEKKYFTPVETKTVLKAIFAWEDDKEERWLEEMSMQGWHLTGTVPYTYYFQKGESKRMVYRLDYKITLDKDYQEYRQIFADAGWELVCVMSNWHYYRILPENDSVPEIYNDNRSKAAKYQRLLVMLLPLLSILWIIPPSFLTNPPPYSGIAWTVIMIIGLAVKVLFIYAIIRVAIRFIHLRQAQHE
jgi:hypothetical protein